MPNLRLIVNNEITKTTPPAGQLKIATPKIAGEVTNTSMEAILKKLALDHKERQEKAGIQLDLPLVLNIDEEDDYAFFF
jgi:hypothetical protein